VGRKTNSVQFSGFGSFITLCYFISSCHDDHTPVTSQHVVATALVGASAKYVNFLVFCMEVFNYFLKKPRRTETPVTSEFQSALCYVVILIKNLRFKSSITDRKESYNFDDF